MSLFRLIPRNIIANIRRSLTSKAADTSNGPSEGSLTRTPAS